MWRRTVSKVLEHMSFLLFFFLLYWFYVKIPWSAMKAQEELLEFFLEKYRWSLAWRGVVRDICYVIFAFLMFPFGEHSQERICVHIKQKDLLGLTLSVVFSLAIISLAVFIGKLVGDLIDFIFVFPIFIPRIGFLAGIALESTLFISGFFARLSKENRV